MTPASLPPAGHALEGARRDLDALDLYWIPLGAGARMVRISGAIYEALSAAVQRRSRQPLFHTALVAHAAGIRYTIEMAPVPDRRGREDRGVVAEGTVGSRWLRPIRVFRYEVRCWANGQVPDLVHAIASPDRITEDLGQIRALLCLTPSVPTPVWGRDELHSGDMWNSNSVTSWLLTSIGRDVADLRPPRHGRAPGWRAGIVAAGSRPQPSGS